VSSELNVSCRASGERVSSDSNMFSARMSSKLCVECVESRESKFKFNSK
jgi:hypothetical protein